MIIKLNKKWQLVNDGRQIMVQEWKKGGENPFKKGTFGADKWYDHGKFFRNNAKHNGIKQALAYISQQEALDGDELSIDEYIDRLDSISQRIEDLVVASGVVG